MHQPRDRTGKNTADFEAYFSELEEIQQACKMAESNGSNSCTDGEDEEAKTPDGEPELRWLKEAGLSSIADTLKDGKILDEGVVDNATSTLTRTQAEAVKKRVEKVNETLRHKQRQESRIPDVRDIFPPNQEHSSMTHTDGRGVAKRGSRRTRSRTLPEGLTSEKLLSKYKDASSGVADSVNSGVKILSLTNTMPITVPSQKGNYDNFLRPHARDSILDLQSSEDISLRQDDLLRSLSAALPNISIARDKLGITPVHFLSPKDIDRVRQIALIELTAMFDRLGLSFQPVRKSSRKKYKDSGIFGVPLTTLVENDRLWRPETDTPLVLQKIISYLEENGLDEEGVLRVPGSSARIKQLREEIETLFYEGKFKFEDLRVNDVVGLLKQFLRDLPTPILTLDYINAFAMVEKIQDRKKQLQCLNLLILVLPDIHRATLKLVLKFLGKVVDHEPQNKMSLNNIAMIMAPNLFTTQSARKKSPDYAELQFAAGTCNVMRMLVKYHNILWVVPFRMMEQVRRMCEVETKKTKDSKSVMTLFRKKDRKSSAAEYDVEDGVIRIQMPGNEKISNTVRLHEHMTAGDIVSHFTQHVVQPSAPEVPFKRTNSRRRSRRKTFERNGDVSGLISQFTPNRTRYFLYEIGGNIGERCLDPDTNMEALLRVNPTAEWVINAKTN
ncbi:rho GTPase-activating protein 18-like isoform X2 [Acanthaster planci]|uniref:Rho GTPase-activating protein 18-like isoform X2 n=1 Tax=Acanthaster planci TaxID=133434 RepID=A0A8B7ZTQ7_ACAPL|nr:rho GTPase-activating protein 18-like isoform X2 [Acanthaster planci]